METTICPIYMAHTPTAVYKLDSLGLAPRLSSRVNKKVLQLTKSWVGLREKVKIYSKFFVPLQNCKGLRMTLGD